MISDKELYEQIEYNSELIGNYFAGSIYTEIQLLADNRYTEILRNIFTKKGYIVKIYSRIKEIAEIQADNQVYVSVDKIDDEIEINVVLLSYILERCKICRNCLLNHNSDIRNELNQIFSELESRGVKVYRFQSPILTEITNLTDDEQWFLDNKTETLRMKAIRSDEQRYVNVFPKYKSVDEIKKIIKSTPIIKKGDIAISKDFKSDTCNVINGYRYTTDVPSEFHNKVFMFGKSQVFGRAVEDSDTIASYIQRLINKEYKNEYCVVNAGIPAVDDANILTQIKETVFCAGDILIYMYLPRRCYNEVKCEKLGYYSLSEAFNEIENRTTMFMDSIPHTTYLGNEVISNYVFGKIELVHEAHIHNNSFKIESKSKQWISEIKKFLDNLTTNRIDDFEDKCIGAIVMNCNPFTNGHRYLIETAVEQVDYLYIFVVEEDKSQFPFKDRIELVRESTKDIDNVCVLPSGQFMISSMTFPEYFLKETNKDIAIDSSKDLDIFGGYISKELNITKRFAGEEPNDPITRQYNMNMRDILPMYGIEFIEIPRIKAGDQVVSATTVRKCLDEKDFAKIERLVPKSTYEYLLSKYN